MKINNIARTFAPFLLGNLVAALVIGWSNTHNQPESGADSPEASLPSPDEWKANPVEALKDQEWVQKHYESLK